MVGYFHYILIGRDTDLSLIRPEATNMDLVKELENSEEEKDNDC
ncbi:MAG: hypothetical protein N2323_01035 [candidate division WOR-3 bacterium]|nr:hypothetical protein [candidate division WOR-3 bacterium]MCX7836530.1 hypothetical protein [candidate division WOR-3 bacterium]MDW8113768.1 hypothetical protein [candidate division WOR-3 bacterium]